jgi:hypothetical protein
MVQKDLEFDDAVQSFEVNKDGRFWVWNIFYQLLAVT